MNLDKLVEQNQALRKIVLKLIDELDCNLKSAEWYRDVFAGWEDCPHEFEHWWRVELPHDLEKARDHAQIALEALEKLKEWRGNV